MSPKSGCTHQNTICNAPRRGGSIRPPPPFCKGRPGKKRDCDGCLIPTFASLGSGIEQILESRKPPASICVSRDSNIKFNPPGCRETSDRDKGGRMIFGELPLDRAEDAILAHTINIDA
ncbi:molybdopterin biosynthesis enzyme, partial [Brucella melitensis]